MKLTTGQKWLRTIAWLRRNFPSHYNTTIRSVPTGKCHGYTEYDKCCFRIKIERRQSFYLRIDTLIHEWAHVLTWFGAETHEDHSSEWGLAYAKIYRTFVEWNYGREVK
jgi:hypothetical protein